MERGNSKIHRRSSGSIRTRIGLAMCISAILVVPVVVLALHYVSGMNSLATVIAESDVEILRLGSLVVQNLLDVRQAERNFLLSGDTAYLLTSRMLIRQITWACEKRRRLDPQLRPVLDSLLTGLGRYNALIDSLPKIRPIFYSVTPEKKLFELRQEHSRLIEAAENTTEQNAQESLLVSAAVLNREIELLQVLGAANAVYLERMQAVFNQTIAAGEKITSYANQRIAEHKGKITRLFARSQRNIITAIIILTTLLVYLLIRLPNSIVLPIKRIANALIRAEQGDLNIHITPGRNDELGGLARQLNRVFARLRDFDDRKASYILELQRRFRLLAGSIKEGVLVVDPAQKILYANPAIEPLLGVKASEASGRPIGELPGLKVLLPYLEQVLSGVGSRQECEVIPTLSWSAVCFEGLRDHNGAVVGALVVVTNPTPPTEESDEGRKGD